MSAAGEPVAGHVRRLWVRGLLALATVLAVLSILAIWANRQLLNPTNWANTSTELLQKVSVRDAVSTFLVDQLYGHVNVEGEIKGGLPKQLKPLAGPISGALHSAAEQGASELLAQPRVQDAWRRANRAADEQLVRIVKEESGIRIRGETVTLELRQILASLGARLGVSASTVEQLPASVAEVRVITSSDLGLVRSILRALRPLALLLTILAAAFYAAALAAGGGFRRRVVMEIGVSLLLAGLAVLAARKILQPQLIGAITKDASLERPANDAYSVSTSLLVQVASSSISIGVPFILAAWLAGPAAWARGTRSFLAPHVRLHPRLLYGLTGGLLAALFAWGPTSATRNPLEMLLFTILALAGAEVLRRGLAGEFPDGDPVSIRGWLRDRGRRLGAGGALARATALSGRAAAPRSLSEELEHLAALHERGAIDEQEFALAKRELLGGK